jgi:uncharacterized protein YgbK (DUF1537 family)
MERAASRGFRLLGLNPDLFFDETGNEANRVMAEASLALTEGHSVILHTSQGPDDPRIAAHADLLAQQGSSTGPAAHIGAVLGALMDNLVAKTPVCRLVVCGGDTSTHVARRLGVEAVEFMAPMAPGSPFAASMLPAARRTVAKLFSRADKWGATISF